MTTTNNEYVGRHRAPDEDDGIDTSFYTSSNAPTISTVDVEMLRRNAYNLLGDGLGDEWDDNPEYSRAIFELLSDTLGYSEEQRDSLISWVEAAGPPPTTCEAQ